jgi:hypothetical protein
MTHRLRYAQFIYLETCFTRSQKKKISKTHVSFIIVTG